MSPPDIVPPKEVLEVKPTSVRLPADMADEIAAIAEETNRSKSDVIVTLLRFALAENKKEQAKKSKR